MDSTKVDKVFRFEEYHNANEKSLDIDTQYNSLTLEDKKLTFQKAKTQEESNALTTRRYLF